jgi:hydrogenase maturation protease
VKVLILGIGSPFGDDSLGWQAIDGLIERGLEQMLTPHEVKMEKADRPGALLLERMRGFDCVILIDALLGGYEPGRVRALNIEEIAQGDSLLSGHGLGVAEALALGEVLGDLPGELHVLGIESGGFESRAQDYPRYGVEPGMLNELLNQISVMVSPRYAPPPAPG